jgi:dipeptidase
MSGREKLQQERIEWLTRAVRGLLKLEFNGELGSRQYEEMEVGKQDAALLEREAQYKSAEKKFADFVSEPDPEVAEKKLQQMLGKEKP